MRVEISGIPDSKVGLKFLIKQIPAIIVIWKRLTLPERIGCG
jgi:hypothetical protein